VGLISAKNKFFFAEPIARLFLWVKLLANLEIDKDGFGSWLYKDGMILWTEYFLMALHFTSDYYSSIFSLSLQRFA
jgi:hypothetical protein